MNTVRTTVSNRIRRSDWAAIPLRLIVGYGMLMHGIAKLARGPADFANILHSLGVPFPVLMSWCTIAVEILAGTAVLFGALVAYAALPLAVVLVVAMFSVHLPYGFSSIELRAVTDAGALSSPLPSWIAFFITQQRSTSVVKVIV
jgi:putative oxidoreductase